MSNDPDLIDNQPEECDECQGEGGWFEEADEDHEVYVDCSACGGSGVL